MGATIATQGLDCCLLGVFSDIRHQETINAYLMKHPGKTYWYPWGNRQKGLQWVLQYLVSRHLWKSERRQSKTPGENPIKIYQPVQSNCPPLWFFHHDAKSQGGDGKIRFQYAIRAVVLSLPPVPIEQKLDYTPIYPRSSTWLGIDAYRTASRLRGEPLDFVADFDRFNLATGKTSRLNEFKDGVGALHEDLLIVQSAYHQSNNKCPQCRSKTP